jgi:peptidylprolyl isomerase
VRGASTRNLAIVAGAVLVLLALIVVFVVRGATSRAHEALAVPLLPEPTSTARPETTSPARPVPSTSAGVGTLTKLTTTVLVHSDGPAVRAGQRLTVHYLLVSYATGEQLDSSWKRGEPFTFTLGAGQVIQGWEQGLPGANVGSRVQLDVPANLAYGDNGIVPGPLRFIVDILAAE